MPITDFHVVKTKMQQVGFYGAALSYSCNNLYIYISSDDYNKKLETGNVFSDP